MRVAKALSCDIVVLFLFFPVNPFRVSVEKKRDQKNCAIFFGPASSQHYNSGGVHRGGGGGGGEPKKPHYITAKSFSNPHTDFGAGRSRRLAVRTATN